MTITRLYFLCLIFILLACKKPETKTIEDPPVINTDLADGFTSNPQEISGYLYADFNGYPSGSGISGNITGYCIFTDPNAQLMLSYNHYTQEENFASNIRGNIKVGAVRFNNLSLSENSNSVNMVSYMQFNSSVPTGFNYDASWKTDGNGVFKPLDVSIPKGFPRIVYPSTSTTFTISRSKDYSISLPGFISNFDSVTVSIGNPTTPQYGLQKNVDATATVITFKKEELSFLNTSGSTNILFQAFNYSNKTVDSKVYVFELANRYGQYANVVN